MRRAPKLHDKRRAGRVHVQREFDVHGRGERVSDDVHLGDLREGRAGVLLRIGFNDLRQRRVQRWSLLHQRVHDPGRSVRDGRARDVRDAIQRVHRMGKSGGVRGGDAELQRRSVRNAAELPSERGGYDELRGGERELLHELGGAGGDVRPDVHE